jgi:hypothetical protein
LRFPKGKSIYDNFYEKGKEDQMEMRKTFNKHWVAGGGWRWKGTGIPRMMKRLQGNRSRYGRRLEESWQQAHSFFDARSQSLEPLNASEADGDKSF